MPGKQDVVPMAVFNPDKSGGPTKSPRPLLLVVVKPPELEPELPLPPPTVVLEEPESEEFEPEPVLVPIEESTPVEELVPTVFVLAPGVWPPVVVVPWVDVEVGL